MPIARVYDRRTRRFALFWALGSLVLFFCSWPSRLYRIPENVSRPTFSEDGRYFATARLTEEDSETAVLGQPHSSLDIWDAQRGRCLHSFAKQYDHIQAISFSQDGRFIAATCDDEVNAWDLTNGARVLSQLEGQLFSVVSAIDGVSLAVILSPLEEPRYQGAPYRAQVRLVEIPTGNEISSIGPIRVYSNNFGPTVTISEDGTRAVTFDPPDSAGANDDNWDMQFQVWDTGSSERLGTIREKAWPAAWALSKDGRTLWLTFKGKSKGSASDHHAAVHLWDLESRRIQAQYVPESDSQEEFAVTNVIRMDAFGPSLLRLEILGGAYIIDTTDQRLRFVAAEGLGNVVSQDGALRAVEEGILVDAAPPFVYHKRNRRLSVRQTSDGAELVSIAAPSNATTTQNWFKPLAFTPDGRQLVYRAYRDTLVARIRTAVADLLSLRSPFRGYRPNEIRCLKLNTGTTHLVGIPSRKLNTAVKMLPDGQHILVGRDMWRVRGQRPWVSIVLLPPLVLLLADLCARMGKKAWASAMLRRRCH